MKHKRQKSGRLVSVYRPTFQVYHGDEKAYRRAQERASKNEEYLFDTYRERRAFERKD